MVIDMKISLLIPEGTRNERAFVLKELAQARNIKDKNTRKSVESGLRKIASHIDDQTCGVAVFSDGDEIFI